MTKKGRENLGKSIGVLLSGGLDSAALVAHYLRKNYTVWPIYVVAGLRWEKSEIYWTKRFLRAVKSPRLKPLSQTRLPLENAYAENWSQKGKVPGAKSRNQAVFLPARNLLLIIRAILKQPNLSDFALATLKGNPFPDGRRSYFKQLGKILSESFLRPIRIHGPFRNLNKRSVIKRYGKWPIHLSFSCINPKGMHHCGRCNKCAERKKAFKKARVKDKTIYC